MKVRIRKTDVTALVVLAIAAALMLVAGGIVARRPLLHDLRAANAATAEAQGIAEDAATLAAQYADQVAGLEARIASLEASATLADDALGNMLEAVEKAGCKVTMSEDGTVTVTAPKPVVVPQSSTSPGGWSSAKVSCYGPGLYGNSTANGSTLTPTMVNFAHKTMKFGTRVEFRYKGRTVTAVCNDRGPYIAGRTFDLGPGTAKALGFSGVGTVEWRTL